MDPFILKYLLFSFFGTATKRNCEKLQQKSQNLEKNMKNFKINPRNTRRTFKVNEEEEEEEEEEERKKERKKWTERERGKFRGEKEKE